MVVFRRLMRLQTRGPRDSCRPNGCKTAVTPALKRPFIRRKEREFRPVCPVHDYSPQSLQSGVVSNFYSKPRKLLAKSSCVVLRGDYLIAASRGLRAFVAKKNVDTE